MNRTLALMCVCFCAGLIGGLGSAASAWLFDSWGIPDLLNVRMAQAFNKTWLYPQLIWGGLWGLVYFLTVGGRNSRRHWVRKALWVSLLPSVFQLFVVYPYWAHQGLLGLHLGEFTALFTVFHNLVWGLTMGIFSRLLWGRH
ncbi:MAG TPA: hypothetical protein VJ910_02805 [Desulfuromonadales bacterium]|nr:hypothetical protein [Desulfuromonadales bacterium]